MTGHEHATRAAELLEMAERLGGMDDRQESRELANAHALTAIALTLPALNRKLDQLALKIERHIRLT